MHAESRKHASHAAIDGEGCSTPFVFKENVILNENPIGSLTACVFCIETFLDTFASSRSHYLR